MKIPSVGFRLLSLLLSLALWTSTALADIDQIEVRVLPEAVVYQESYSLGDIAELDGFDIEAIQKLAKVKIGRSPMAGHSIKLVKLYLERKLIGRIPGKKIKLIVPKGAFVSRASVKIEKAELKKIILSEIEKRYQTYDQVSIKLKTRLKDLFLPKGKTSYNIKRIGKPTRIGGVGSWMLSLFLDGKLVKKLLVRATVKVTGEVLVAKTPIEQGKKIKDTDLIRVKKDISSERIGFNPKKNLMVGQQAIRPIRPNEQVRQRMVEQPVVLAKGAPVRLVYRSQSLYLTNLAIAMKSGRKGDVIPVRTMGTKKTIYATVVDSKLVEVAL